MLRVRKGFLLIELMIVVAIIGIVATLMIPLWQDWQDRTILDQISEGRFRAGSIKASTSKFFIDNGVWPANLAAMGITAISTGKYVSGVTMNTGTITLTYGLQASGNIAGESLSLKPLVNAKNEVIWVCGRGSAPAGAVEAPTGASGADATSAGILDRYLPFDCR